MRRLLALFTLVAVAIGGVLFHFVFQIDGLEGVLVRRREQAEGGPGVYGPGDESTEPRSVDRVRIGSFNIRTFGPSKAEKPRVMNIIAEVVRKFDVIAVQEIRSRDQSLIPNLIERVNAAGARYEYVLGPRLGRTSSKEQYAFLFDSETIEIDRQATYTVEDPYDRMHREPLVTLFRARGANPDEAFTFKLVNVHVDPDLVEEEMNALDDVYRAVLMDGDQEDDIILIGDFNTGENAYYQLGEISGMTWALSGVTTNTAGTKAYDNLIFHQRNTSEFIGRAGVIDMVRTFNLTTPEAVEVSDHLPVWGDFSAYEGGQPGRIAVRPGEDTLR